jgi:oligopeptide transport system permease protein
MGRRKTALVAPYLLRRVLTLVPVWLCTTLAAFLFVHAIPGGPFDTGAVRTAETEQILKRHFHLDQPLFVQYGLFVKGVLHGDLGESLVQRGLTTTEVLRDRLPTSASLGFAAMLVALGIGFPVGILAAARHNKALDHLLMLFASLGYAIPNFVLSIVLILVVGLKLGWLPLGGWGDVRHAVLPALALGLPWAGLLARLTRTAMLEALSADHVQMARAKGLSERRVLLKHAVRNALLPVVTVVPVLVAELIVGSLVVESIFGISGVGQYFIQSVLGRDYSLMLGFIVFYASLIFAANLIVDLAYVWLDPRIRVA